MDDDADDDDDDRDPSAPPTPRQDLADLMEAAFVVGSSENHNKLGSLLSSVLAQHDIQSVLPDLLQRLQRHGQVAMARLYLNFQEYFQESFRMA